MQNIDIVRDFLSAYKVHDYERMRPLLAADVHFTDFAFDISGDDVHAMWRWFCTRPEPVEIPWFGDILVNGTTVTAGYRVAYTYGEHRRPIDYVIRSTFTIANGRIAEQHDCGSIFTWTRQAFGLLPALFSWTPTFQARVGQKAREKLDAFIHSTGAAASIAPRACPQPSTTPRR